MSSRSSCAIASATYLLNDLLDIEADRAHPSKRRRPFAAGALPSWLAGRDAPVETAAPQQSDWSLHDRDAGSNCPPADAGRDDLSHDGALLPPDRGLDHARRVLLGG